MLFRLAALACLTALVVEVSLLAEHTVTIVRVEHVIAASDREAARADTAPARVIHVAVTRDDLAAAVLDPAPWLQGARAVPHVVDGRVRGFELRGIRPGTYLASIGLENGDVVEAINGTPLPDTRSCSMGWLPTPTRVDRAEVSLSRRGTSIRLVVLIADTDGADDDGGHGA